MEWPKLKCGDLRPPVVGRADPCRVSMGFAGRRDPGLALTYV